jgi:TonB family protein
VESIVSGVNMTKRNLLFPLAAALVTLPVVIGIAAWQFPLRAAPQEAADDPGVELQAGAVRILHRTGIAFPDEARAKHLSGTVVVNVSVDDKGEVTGAQAQSGPDELRKPVVQSILNWHFSLDSTSAPHTFEVAVRFDGGQALPPGVSEPNMVPPGASDVPRTVESINLITLPAALRDKITQSGILHVGDVLNRESFSKVEASLRNIDDHLRLTGALQHEDKVALMVHLDTGTPWKYNVTPRKGTGQGGGALSAAPVPMRAQSTNAPASTAETPKSIRVGGNVQSANLLQKVRPAYPPLAKQARIQGLVRFEALIGADGFVKNLQVVSGHPMLVEAAQEAVKQWVYRPTLLNGNPTDVITTIDVNFTLSDTPPAAQAAPQQ